MTGEFSKIKVIGQREILDMHQILDSDAESEEKNLSHLNA